MNEIKFGDCRDIMSDWELLGVKAQMCVTSPPYFGLRDYGTGKWAAERRRRLHKRSVGNIWDAN